MPADPTSWAGLAVVTMVALSVMAVVGWAVSVVEALERFVRNEPLRLTHECVFGVLALESEPVDPRL